MVITVVPSFFNFQYPKALIEQGLVQNLYEYVNGI